MYRVPRNITSQADGENTLAGLPPHQDAEREPVPPRASLLFFPSAPGSARAPVLRFQIGLSPPIPACSQGTGRSATSQLLGTNGAPKGQGDSRARLLLLRTCPHCKSTEESARAQGYREARARCLSPRSSSSSFPRTTPNGGMVSSSCCLQVSRVEGCRRSTNQHLHRLHQEARRVPS